MNRPAYKHDKTFEEFVGTAALKRVGKVWSIGRGSAGGQSSAELE
jgi:hypothetical protein